MPKRKHALPASRGTLHLVLSCRHLRRGWALFHPPCHDAGPSYRHRVGLAPLNIIEIVLYFMRIDVFKIHGYIFEYEMVRAVLHIPPILISQHICALAKRPKSARPLSLCLAAAGKCDLFATRGCVMSHIKALTPIARCDPHKCTRT